MNHRIDIEKISAPYKALGNPNRMRVFLFLLGPSAGCKVTDIAEALHSKQPNVSQYLHLLERAGLVRHRREKTGVVYSVDSENQKELISLMKSLS